MNNLQVIEILNRMYDETRTAKLYFYTMPKKK